MTRCSPVMRTATDIALYDYRLGLAFGLLGDFAKVEDFLAFAGQRSSDSLCLIGGHHNYHTDAAVEYTMHFGIGYATLLLQPREQLGHGPRVAMQAGRQARLQDARYVIEQAATGNVRQTLDSVAMLGQRSQNRLHIDACGLHDHIAQGTAMEVL